MLLFRISANIRFDALFPAFVARALYQKEAVRSRSFHEMRAGVAPLTLPFTLQAVWLVSVPASSARHTGLWRALLAGTVILAQE
jgi:hypothetical protein